MARYTGSVCRLCRREKTKLYLKGDRCYTDKCAISRRNYEPGQHGQSRKKLSNHATQLREKQKVKRYYGLLENKFRNYFEVADKMHGVTGENLLKILESRLDNVVYRLGLATSRAEARQLVVHGHFLLNGQKATIPSMQVSKGDVIELKSKSKSSEKFKEIAENHKTTVPQWMEVDIEKMTGRIVGEPVREDIELPIEEHLIVEWYSK